MNIAWCSAVVTCEENFSMSFETIAFAVDAGVARLTLNRPDRLNSFTDQMHAEIREALSEVNANVAIRVLVLTGAGHRY